MLYNHSSKSFWLRVCVPAGLDVFSTAMVVAALAFVTSAAVAGILKTALQLVLVTLGSRVFLGKTQNEMSVLWLCTVLLGVGVVLAVETIFYDDDRSNPKAVLAEDLQDDVRSEERAEDALFLSLVGFGALPMWI